MTEHTPRNPFICGGPVPSSYFVGREREVRTIFDQIASLARGSVAISGDRRMGKTSLLQYVCDPAIIESWGLSRDEYLFIYLDCPTMGSFAPAQFWQKILTLLLDEARGTSLVSLMETIRGILAKETIHQTDFEIVLDEIHRTGRALALLLDEFEWVVDPRDEYTARVFLSGLRALTTRRPRVFSLVVATREELKKLCEPIAFKTSPFYNNFLFRRLKPFTKKEIKQLFEKTLKGTGIEFGPEEHKCIRTLGGTHPYLIQLAGALVFDIQAEGLKVVDCLERINSEFEEQTRHHFDEVWEDSSLQERMLSILFALCGLARQEEERTYDVETLQHILSRDERALTFLAERGLITRAGSTTALSPPMFESWVLREIRSCDEKEFTEYASLMFNLLAKREAECVVEAMRLASGREIGKREAQFSPKIAPSPIPGKFKIFVSSTSLDLQRERQAVEEALHRMCTVSFSGMEYFGSRPETPKEVCLKEVSRANVYIGIFAHRYGYIDSESGLSMTELEYRKARECNIPCLIYMMDQSVPVLPTHIEQDPEVVAKLKALKQDLLSKHAVSFFTNPDNLAMQVTADLNNLFRERGIESEKRAIFPENGGPAMTSPIDQLALKVLAQATQFLFAELGRRLDFWRKEKGEQATPESIEPVSRPDGVIVKLDDLERQVDMQRLLLKREEIEVSMHVIREKKRIVGELRKQAANALTPPVEQARIKAGIRGIEDEITLESNKLEALLKEVYGESSEE